MTAALHVFYLPPGADPTAKTYLELFADGMIDLIITLTPRTENPAPSEADPNQMAGGYAPFDVRGERGVVQRSPHGRVVATWWEGTERGRFQHTVVSTLEPEDTVALARSLERSPSGPPDAYRI